MQWFDFTGLKQFKIGSTVWSYKISVNTDKSIVTAFHYGPKELKIVACEGAFKGVQLQSEDGEFSVVPSNTDVVFLTEKDCNFSYNLELEELKEELTLKIDRLTNLRSTFQSL